MAKIGNDRTIVRAECRDDGTWLFLVSYTACFTPAEIGRRFDDSVLVGPEQSGGGYESPVTFTACSPRVFRRKRIVVRTDAGMSSAVRGWIRLHRNESDEVDDEQCTPVLVPAASAPTRHHRSVPVLALR